MVHAKCLGDRCTVATRESTPKPLHVGWAVRVKVGATGSANPDYICSRSKDKEGITRELAAWNARPADGPELRK